MLHWFTEFISLLYLLLEEPYWQGWFEGISSKFTSAPVAKLLLLAGVDRLDKELTIAQMQGKFQMQVFAGAGHSIHEDAPGQWLSRGEASVEADCLFYFMDYGMASSLNALYACGLDQMQNVLRKLLPPSWSVCASPAVSEKKRLCWT